MVRGLGAFSAAGQVRVKKMSPFEGRGSALGKVR